MVIKSPGESIPHCQNQLAPMLICRLFDRAHQGLRLWDRRLWRLRGAANALSYDPVPGVVV
jgi:hypothetical protein